MHHPASPSPCHHHSPLHPCIPLFPFFGSHGGGEWSARLAAGAPHAGQAAALAGLGSRWARSACCPAGLQRLPCPPLGWERIGHPLPVAAAGRRRPGRSHRGLRSPALAGYIKGKCYELSRCRPHANNVSPMEMKRWHPDGSCISAAITRQVPLAGGRQGPGNPFIPSHP